MKFEYFLAVNGAWRWRIRDRAGRAIAQGTRDYVSRTSVLRAIARAQKGFAPVEPWPVVRLGQES